MTTWTAGIAKSQTSKTEIAVSVAADQGIRGKDVEGIVHSAIEGVHTEVKIDPDLLARGTASRETSTGAIVMCHLAGVAWDTAVAAGVNPTLQHPMTHRQVIAREVGVEARRKEVSIQRQKTAAIDQLDTPGLERDLGQLTETRTDPGGAGMRGIAIILIVAHRLRSDVDTLPQGVALRRGVDGVPRRLVRGVHHKPVTAVVAITRQAMTLATRPLKDAGLIVTTAAQTTIAAKDQRVVTPQEEKARAGEGGTVPQPLRRHGVEINQLMLWKANPCWSPNLNGIDEIDSQRPTCG